jgi:hypothetical protein
MLCLEDMGELDYLSTHRYGQCLTSAAKHITYIDTYIVTAITSLFFIMIYSPRCMSLLVSSILLVYLSMG